MDIGSKLKLLRVSSGLTQEELANRVELSKGFISQVERNLTSPSIATLIDILQCLGTNLNDFFTDKEEKQVAYHHDDFFEKIDEKLGNKVEWIVPDSQMNDMEPILLTLKPYGKSETGLPHPGEEFGYVISGSILLHIGSKNYKVKKGGSFYFSPTREHYVETGKSGATLIWVSTPPSF